MAQCKKYGKDLQPGEGCPKCAQETKPGIKIGSLVISKAALIAVICSLLVLLTIGGIAGVRAVRSHQAKDNLNPGNTYLLDGKYEQAIRAFNKTIKRDPGNIEAMLGKAKALIALKRANEAEAVLDEALKIDPQVPAIYLGLCEVYLERGDIPRILTLLDSGYKLTQDYEIQALLKSYQDRVSIVASSTSLYVNKPTNFRLVYKDDYLTADLKASWSIDGAGSFITSKSDGSVDITLSELGEVTVHAVYGSLSKESTFTCRDSESNSSDLSRWQALLDAGQVTSCINDLYRQLERDPDWHEGRAFLAGIEIEQGELESATNHLIILAKAEYNTNSLEEAIVSKVVPQLVSSVYPPPLAVLKQAFSEEWHWPRFLYIRIAIKYWDLTAATAQLKYLADHNVDVSWIKPEALWALAEELLFFYHQDIDAPKAKECIQIIHSFLSKDPQWSKQTAALSAALNPPPAPTPTRIIDLKDWWAVDWYYLEYTALSPDASYLFYHARGETLKSWDLKRGDIVSMATGKLVLNVPESENFAGRAAWSRDSRYFAMETKNNFVIYDLSTKKLVAQVAPENSKARLRLLGWTPDSLLWVEQTNSFQLVSYSPATGERTKIGGSTAAYPSLTATGKVAYLEGVDEYGWTVDTLKVTVDGVTRSYQVPEARIEGWLPEDAGIQLLKNFYDGAVILDLASGELTHLDIKRFLPLPGGWVNRYQVYGNYLIDEGEDEYSWYEVMLMDIRDLSVTATGLHNSTLSGGRIILHHTDSGVCIYQMFD